MPFTNKPGPPRRIQGSVEVINLPRMPQNLSEKQQRVWKSLLKNPLLAEGDEFLLREFMDTLRLRDESWDSLRKEGVIIMGQKGPRKNPAYQIFRESQEMLLKLCRELAVSPRVRNALRITTVGNNLQEADDGFSELLD